MRVEFVSSCFLLCALLAACKEQPRVERAKPGDDKPKSVLASKRICSDAGWQFVHEKQREGEAVLNPRFAYNEKLDTCLCRYGITNEAQFEVWIYDTLSNRDLAALMRNRKTGETTSTLSQAKFEARAKELMGSAD